MTKYRDMSKEEKKAYHKAYYEAHKEELKKSSNEPVIKWKEGK